MTCKECKGSGKYQPLIGPPEACQLCCVSTVPFNLIACSYVLLIEMESSLVCKMLKDIRGQGLLAPLKGFHRVDGLFEIIDKADIFEALSIIYQDTPKLFQSLFPDYQIPVIIVEEPKDDL